MESNLSSSIVKTPTKHLLSPKPASSTPNRTPNSSASILQAVQANSLLLEYSSLRVDCPAGCYLMPFRDNFHCWNGHLFVHCDEPSPFAGTVIQFSIEWPNEEQVFSIGSAKPKGIPTIKVHSPNSLMHPLLKTGNEFDLVPMLENTEGRISIGRLMRMFLDSFRETGLEAIVGRFKAEFECGNVQRIPNVEAFRMLLQDRAAFNKLAERAWNSDAKC